jgi:hypothetical protein
LPAGVKAVEARKILPARVRCVSGDCKSTQEVSGHESTNEGKDP